MKKEKPPVTYDTRYRYKLDMLEPGTIMLEWVGIFLLIGLALELLRWKLAAAIAFGFSGALCATRVCRFSEEKLGQMLSVEFQAMMLLVKSQAEDASCAFWIRTGSSARSAAERRGRRSGRIPSWKTFRCFARSAGGRS